MQCFSDLSRLTLLMHFQIVDHFSTQNHTESSIIAAQKLLSDSFFIRGGLSIVF